MDNKKTLKDYAKEAKKRMKSGYWEKYRQNLTERLAIAESIGESKEKIKDYFSISVQNEIKNNDKSEENFYNKVKEILDTEGEISNAIGRLTDRKIFDSLSYEEKQRYTLTLSEKYLKAVERYNREKSLNI